MTYNDFRQKQQDEVNQFPFGFAFSKEQFNEMMANWGLDPEKDIDKIRSIGGGGYVRRTDVLEMLKMFKRLKEEKKEFMSDINNFESAIYEEMWNHEYDYNLQGAYDVCSCFGEIEYCGDDLTEDDEIQVYANKLGWNDEQLKAYFKARKRYYKKFYEEEE